MVNLYRNLRSQLTVDRFRAAIRSPQGAIDLASIMVGVLVIGIIGLIIAAMVFMVIPWSQDEAAKGNLSAVRTAEGVAYVQNGNRFVQGSELVAQALATNLDDAGVAIDAEGTCYVSAALSGSGTIWVSHSKTTEARPYEGIDHAFYNWCVSDISDLIADLGADPEVPGGYTGPLTVRANSVFPSNPSDAVAYGGVHNVALVDDVSLDGLGAQVPQALLDLMEPWNDTNSLGESESGSRIFTTPTNLRAEVAGSPVPLGVDDPSSVVFSIDTFHNETSGYRFSQIDLSLGGAEVAGHTAADYELFLSWGDIFLEVAGTTVKFELRQGLVPEPDASFEFGGIRATVAELGVGAYISHGGATALDRTSLQFQYGFPWLAGISNPVYNTTAVTGVRAWIGETEVTITASAAWVVSITPEEVTLGVAAAGGEIFIGGDLQAFLDNGRVTMTIDGVANNTFFIGLPPYDDSSHPGGSVDFTSDGHRLPVEAIVTPEGNVAVRVAAIAGKSSAPIRTLLDSVLPGPTAGSWHRDLGSATLVVGGHTLTGAAPTSVTGVGCGSEECPDFRDFTMSSVRNTLDPGRSGLAIGWVEFDVAATGMSAADVKDALEGAQSTVLTFVAGNVTLSFDTTLLVWVIS